MVLAKLAVPAVWRLPVENVLEGGFLLIYLVIILIFTGSFLLAAGLIELAMQRRILISERLARIQRAGRGPARIREELQQPLFKRLGMPLLQKTARIFSRRMSEEKRIKFLKRLQAAGNPLGLDPGSFRLAQCCLAIMAGLVFFGFGRLWGLALAGAVYLFLFGGASGWVLPEVYLSAKVRERRRLVERSLSDVLDLLTVSVEAGLSFEISLVKVTERFKGTLAEEFGRVLHEMKLGKPRRDALRDLAERLGIEDLTSLVAALTQAEQMGVSIGNILRLQAEQMRRKRRQRAEEKAMQAPIKMLFPLVFFIFPALFIILLGPALIQIMRNF